MTELEVMPPAAPFREDDRRIKHFAGPIFKFLSILGHAFVILGSVLP